MLQETITVTGDAPVVDVQSTRQRQVVGMEIGPAFNGGGTSFYAQDQWTKKDWDKKGSFGGPIEGDQL